MNEDGSSRCFVHLAAEVQATTRSSGRRFEVLLPGATVRARNHLNVLETRFFDTPLLRAKLERRGRQGLALVLTLRADIAPTMSVEPAEGGGVLLVVTMPDGAYVDGPPTIASSEVDYGSEPARGTGSVRLSESERAEAAAAEAQRANVAAPAPAPAPAQTAPAPAPAQTAPAPAPTPAPEQRRTTPVYDDEDDERPPIFGGGR